MNTKIVKGHQLTSTYLETSRHTGHPVGFQVVCECGWVGPVVPMFSDRMAADSRAASQAHLDEAKTAQAGAA